MRRSLHAKHDRHWAHIAETGTTIGMSILIFVYRLGGRRLFKLFLFPVIVFYFLLRADSRQASKKYLLRVSGVVADMEKVTWRLSFIHFWQFALSLIDKFAIWMGKIPQDKVVTHNLEIIDQLISRSKGGIFAISHLGNFEIISAMSQRHKGVKLTVLHHTKHAEKFNRLLKKYNANSTVELLQVTALDAVLGMRLNEKVSRGEFIAIASDRLPVSNKKATVSCSFLGEQADFPTGPYVLANILSVPIIMLVCVKEQGVYHAYFETLSEPKKLARSERDVFISETAQRFATRLEYYVCKEPLQWFNFYHFWHQENNQDI